MKILTTILLFSLLALIFASCSKDSELPIAQDHETEYTYIRAGFGPLTYATAPSASAELRLFSVAFFIETADGTFHKYMSHRSTSDPVGQGIKGDFEAVVMSTNNYNYEGVTIKMEGLVYGPMRVAVVGNYDTERGVGIEDKLVAVENMDELLGMKLDAPQAGIFVNLLTYDYQIIDMTNALSTNISFNMKRAAARVVMPFVFTANGSPLDLSGPIKKNLAECSLMVYNPKSGTYLIDPALDNTLSAAEAVAKINAIPQREYMGPIKFTTAGNTILGIPDSHFLFYTYEMAGSDANNLEVYVILKVRASTNDPWQEQIHAVLGYESTGGKTVIKRNAAYIVDNPYNIDVDTDGWNEGGIWGIFN